jgi:hypothetical protein
MAKFTELTWKGNPFEKSLAIDQYLKLTNLGCLNV